MAKAFRVLNEGEAIASSAPKTHAFAMNVGLLSPDHVTIDKWHMSGPALTKPIDGVTDTVETVTDKQYRRIEAITAQIAKVNGFKGFELQAIIWVAIKATWNR
jgi:thermostable 8-oxoguanine DNA glycosylase